MLCDFTIWRMSACIIHNVQCTSLRCQRYVIFCCSADGESSKQRMSGRLLAAAQEDASKYQAKLDEAEAEEEDLDALE